MRKLLLLILLFTAIYRQSIAQNTATADSSGTKAEKVKRAENIVLTKVDVQPEIDKDVWNKFLTKQINYDIAIFNDAPRGLYIVKVKFTVFADGHVGDVVAMTKFGYGMEREVVKALKKSPNWKPASQDGKPVDATVIQTVRFGIEIL